MAPTPRRARAGRNIVLAAAALCLGATLAARPFNAAQGPQAAPQQPPRFRTNVDLVQVDVVVVDKGGNPVRGLKAGDFALFDRRKPQAIANFEEISHEHAAEPAPSLARPPAMDVANNTTAQSDRLVVMVVDDLHIWKGRTDRAKDIARKVLTDLGSRSSMAVLFTSGDHSTQVTVDPAVLSAAVDTLKGRQTWRRPHPAVDEQKVGRVDPEMPMGALVETISKGNDAKLQDFFDNLAQYKTLQNAARLLGVGDARRKAFVLLSEGIGKDLSGIFGAMAPPGDAPEGGVEYARTGNAAATMTVAPTGYHVAALIEMMEAMRRGNVATYAVDPRGRVTDDDLAQECFPPPRNMTLADDPCSAGLTHWESPVRQAQQGLTLMAEASGGYAVTDSDDFTSGVNRIVDDLDHYYLLGFYQSAPQGKGYRPLDVRVPGHPDWTLRFRKGYEPGGPPPAPKNSNPLVALSAGVIPKTDLALRLTAIAMPGATKTARVLLALEVSAPLRDLQERDGKVRDDLKYEVMAVDEKKAKAASLTGLEGRLTLSPNTAAGPPPETISYQVSAALDVPPGRYQLRASAISAKLAKGGSVYLELEVPDFTAAPLALSGLAVGFADGPHVPVAPASITSAVAAGPSSRVEGLPFPPSLDRVFAARDTLRLFFQVVQKAPRAITTSAAIVDANDRVVSSSEDIPNQRGQVDTILPLAALAPGAYRLRVTATDGPNTARREIGFVIR